MNNRNNALIVIRVVVWIFMIGAAAISTRHIVHVSQMLGLGWESYTVPAFVDGIAIVGKVSMLPRFSNAFRRSGFRLLMFGGVLSLAANVAAGDNWGERAFGVLVVAGFMLLESHATKADRTAVAPTPASRKLDPEVAAERARKARATREANRLAALTPAQRAAQTRRTRAVAPTSPGMPRVPSPPMAVVQAAAK
jgi:hypothetical protein